MAKRTSMQRKRREPGTVNRYNFHFLRGGRRQHWWTYDKGKATSVKKSAQQRGEDFGITVTEHPAVSLSGRMMLLNQEED